MEEFFHFGVSSGCNIRRMISRKGQEQPRFPPRHFGIHAEVTLGSRIVFPKRMYYVVVSDLAKLSYLIGRLVVSQICSKVLFLLGHALITDTSFSWCKGPGLQANGVWG